jgi:RND family efflux transporter MFP subunit
MIQKILLPFLALAGLTVGIYVAMSGSKTVTPAAPVSEAPHSPYPEFVAGAAIVEASTENISIGTNFPGIVSQLYVAVGSQVKAGDPLFLIDDRAAAAELALRQAAVKVAEAQLKDAADNLEFYEKIDKDSVTAEDVTKRRNTRLIAEAQLELARAQLKVASTEMERLTVRAPVGGQVLQLKVHPGEFAPTGVLATPLILLGATEPVHVRVDVDENDAWRIKSGAAATGFLRGNKNLKTAMRFVRFEPYVVPKKSLTGDSTERVDTRVLQVIYSFDRGSLPIYVGQQMDVFIDAPDRENLP